MKFIDLKNEIKKLENDNVKDDTEVFIKCVFNHCGNIIEADEIKKDTYGFFGSKEDCLIIGPIDR